MFRVYVCTLSVGLACAVGSASVTWHTISQGVLTDGAPTSPGDPAASFEIDYTAPAGGRLISVLGLVAVHGAQPATLHVQFEGGPVLDIPLSPSAQGVFQIYDPADPDALNVQMPPGAPRIEIPPAMRDTFLDGRLSGTYWMDGPPPGGTVKTQISAQVVYEVPEPAALGLVSVGLLLLRRRRSNRR